MKLKKTQNDIEVENRDLERDYTLIFLQEMDNLKFKVGDILIKKVYNEDTDAMGDVTPSWETDTYDIGAPVKYVYAFENKLGIGYIKELKPDGKGPTRAQPVCMTEVFRDRERVQLDPEYAEHLLLSPEEEFKYHATYERMAAYREEALKKNKELIVRTKEPARLNKYGEASYDDSKTFKEFWKDLKVGDIVYTTEEYLPDEEETKEDGDVSENESGDMNNALECLGEFELLVVKTTKGNRTIRFQVLKDETEYSFTIGEEFSWSRNDFSGTHSIATKQKPHPLTEDNI